MALSRLEEIFHMAANDGDLKLLKKVANSKDETGEKKTALHKASENGHLKMVKVLIHIGAEIEAKDEDGWTPLHFAAFNDKLDVVKYLIKKGSKIHAKDNHQQTALHKANNFDIAKLLIQNGATGKSEGSLKSIRTSSF